MTDRTEAEIRNAALEEAKRACKALPYENFALTEAISAIRALKSAPTTQAPAKGADVVDVDALANEIRRVDGNNSLGAGALAEALMPFLQAHSATKGESNG